MTTVTGFGMLLAAVLGLISATGEFRHGSATLTYLATPQPGPGAGGQGGRRGLLRSRVRPGRRAGGRRASGSVFAAGHRGTLALGAGALAGHAAGAVLGGALLAALGVALGSLVRSQLAAIIGIFVWAVLIESLLGGLFPAIRPYLPYTAATTLAGAPLGGAAFGPAHELSGGGPLPFVAAAALIAAVTAPWP